jgi:hypothetical protein
MDQFLEFCVSTGEMEAVFLQLVEEYRAAPTIAKAVALFDIFCAPCAPAKVKADAALPPNDMRIEQAMRKIKLNWTRMQAAFVFGPTTNICTAPPPRSLFDVLARDIAESEHFQKIRGRYRAWLSGGRPYTSPLNQIQQHFLERIWQPIIRPHLLAAGFFELPAAEAAAA